MILMNNITYGNTKNKYLFNDLDFNANSGKIIGLVGAKGAGKSQFLKLLAGLLRPKKGNIIVNGYVPLKRNPNFLAEMFFVDQVTFYPKLSIKKYTKVLAQYYKDFDIHKLQNILKEFNIDESLKLNKISKSDQKKFIIAFALATNSKLLLLDDPTNDLEASFKSIFRKVLISSINKEQTVVITAQEPKDIETIIDEVVILDKGEIIFQKDVAKITKKLAFKIIPTLMDSDAILYSEKYADEFKAIFKANTVNETKIDLELLLNAVVKKIEFKI